MGTIRKAKISDVKEIQQLIKGWADQDAMLPRAVAELYDDLRDFFVYEEDGGILGTAALHVCWENLAEIRSVAVDPGHGKKRIGTALVKACLAEAKELEIKRVFVLTFVPAYFEKLGFILCERDTLPHKIWADCIKCHKFPDCDEVPMEIQP